MSDSETHQPKRRRIENMVDHAAVYLVGFGGLHGDLSADKRKQPAKQRVRYLAERDVERVFLALLSLALVGIS